MDFMCLTANCGQKYAIQIKDLVAIIQVPEITGLPGEAGAVVGMISRLGVLVPVVDIALLYSGIVGDSHYLVILNGTQQFGILVEEVHDIVRGEIPKDVRFLDVHDFELSIKTYNQKSADIELF